MQKISSLKIHHVNLFSYICSKDKGKYYNFVIYEYKKIQRE